MIKEYRQKAGMTQEEFSKVFGVPLGTVKHWDSGQRKPPEWAEKLIIEKLEEINGKEDAKMSDLYSPYYDMACQDIGSNGYRVLAVEKYQKIIAKTVIKKFKNGLGEMEWRDKDGFLIAHHAGTLEPDWYPRVGEVIEEDKGK